MSTDDQFPVNDLDALRALILGEDDAAVRSVSKLARRIDTVEEMLRDDPASVERLQAVLGDVLHGLEGDKRRLVQERLTALLLTNIQNEIKALVKAGELAKAEEKTTIDKQRASTFNERQQILLTNGASNAEYHYLGSAKILGQIGQAFAEALLKLNRP